MLKEILNKQEELNDLSKEICTSLSDYSKTLNDLVLQVNNIEENLNALKYTSDICKSDLINIQSKLKYSNLELLNINVDKTKKNILLCGFYGGDNVGDELMLQTILDYFKKYDNVFVTVLLDYNDKYNILKNGYKNVSYLHYPKSVYDFDLLVSKFDKLVFGSGAIIDDRNYNFDDPFSITLSKLLIELSIKFIDNNKDVYWIGLSSNIDFKNAIFVKKLKYIVDNAKYISLRDINSLNLLTKHGCNKKKIKIIHDIIIGNEKWDNLKENNESNSIAFVPICYSESDEENIFILKRLIKYLDENKLNYTINLIPFYDFVNNDINYLTKLKEKVNDNKRIFICEFASNFNEVINLLNENKYVISMRYHSSLISMIESKNLLTFLYDKHTHYYNKISYIYEKYASDNNVINISESKDENRLKKAFDDLFKTKRKPQFEKNNIKEAQKKLKEILEEMEL